MTVALIALLASLCGTVYAASSISGKSIRVGSEPGNRLKKDSVTGKQVRESTLGQVPTATHAGTAQTANTAGVATSLASPEPFHEVNTAGEPPFQNGWSNSGGSLETVGFYKDAEGVVHLKGDATGSNNMTIFQLPPGYRPASGKELQISAVCTCTVTDSNSPTPDEVVVPTGKLVIFGTLGFPAADGSVSISPSPSSVSLDGITFRAGS